MATDVLFVNPPSPDGGVWIRDICRRGRKSHERMIWPQTCLAYPAAVMAEKGANVAVIDCIAEGTSWPDFEAYLKSKKPKYVVHHIADPTAENDARVAKLAHDIGAKSIAIGPHVTGVTRPTMQAFPWLDFIAKNEVEEIIPDLIDANENGRNFESITGIAWRENGEVFDNPNRPFIADFDKLPFPRHDLLPLDKHRMPLVGTRYTYVLQSRGCPYPCTFCVEAVLSWHKVRSRSPEKIVEELEWLDKDLGVRNILFQADLFTARKKEVRELCELIIERKLNVRWTCNSRVDTVDEKLLRLMKAAGCWLIAYGVESGSQTVLDACKKMTTVEQIEKTIKLAHEIGIMNWGYFIIGLPGETHETIQETIDLSKRLPFDLVLFHTAAPYIGTPFYEEAKEKGWLVSEDWSSFDMNDSYNVSYENLSAADIEKGVKRAFREWYMRPSVGWNLLRRAGGLEHIWWFAKTGFENLLWSRTRKVSDVVEAVR